MHSPRKGYSVERWLSPVILYCTLYIVQSTGRQKDRILWFRIRQSGGDNVFKYKYKMLRVLLRNKQIILCNFVFWQAKQSATAASFNCTGAVRKAGFLSVKKWLLRKKHQASQLGTNSEKFPKIFESTLLENLTDDSITQLFGTKFSTISLYLTKLYVTLSFSLASSGNFSVLVLTVHCQKLYIHKSEQCIKDLTINITYIPHHNGTIFRLVEQNSTYCTGLHTA